MSVLFYKRPSYIPSAPGYVNAQSCQRYVERASAAGSSRAIPEALSFEAVLDNKTLPPCALGDFMDYLMYVAKDAENLQFFLWYRDYCARFDKLDDYEKNLSKEWKGSTGDILEATKGSWPFGEEDDFNPPSSSYGKGGHREFVTALPSEGDDEDSEYKSFVEKSATAQRKTMSSFEEAKKANREAGLTGAWTGFTIQPFRAEVTRIITHYFGPSAPRQLNIAPAVIAQVLHALQHTTHPSAFNAAIALITPHLKHHSHPNFIRWSICNGNKPRVFFVRTMGIFHTFLGFLTAILLVLSSASRWWRLFAAPNWFLGIATEVAAYKGLCMILHASHQRAIKPWEDPAALYSTFTGGLASDSDEGLPQDVEMNEKHMSEKSSLETFGSSNDSYTTRSSWVQKYEKQSVVKKVFSASIAVQDSAVRIMQDRIARMAQLWAIILTIVLTVVFTALPAGNFY